MFNANTQQWDNWLIGWAFVWSYHFRTANKMCFICNAMDDFDYDVYNYIV